MPNGRRPAPARKRANSTRPGTALSTQRTDAAEEKGSAPGTRYRYWCRVCEHEADARRKIEVAGGFYVGNSFSPRCPKQGECLRLVAEKVGTTPAELLENPFRHLEAAGWLGGTRARVVSGTRKEAPVSCMSWLAWRSRLRADQEALRELSRRGFRSPGQLGLAERKVGGETYTAFAIPAFKGGVSSATFRFFPDHPGRKSDNLRGWAAGWVPSAPSTEFVLLVAGVLDAAVARQRGLPYAVSTDVGAKLPGHLLADLAGREVAVLYDVGEEAQAAASVEKLQGVARTAWVATLPLTEGGSDICDWFGGYERSRDELIADIRRQRSKGRP